MLASDLLIHSMEDLAALVERCGFLPLLAGRIPGFSVEEHTPPELWFADGVDGPWEWKGPVIESLGCAYGKFFFSKAGFVSREWFAPLLNLRRRGMDFYERASRGHERFENRRLYEIIEENAGISSRLWRRLAGVENRGHFDSIVTRLQMSCDVLTVGFDYDIGSGGRPYGWGIAQFATVEDYFGQSYVDAACEESVEESRSRIQEHLEALLPEADPRIIAKLIG